MGKFLKILLCMMLVLSLCTPMGLVSGETTTDVNDATIRNFETDTGYQLQNSTGQWVGNGLGNSSGALEITATNAENGGVQFNSLHMKPGVTYDISVMVKPTGSSTISNINYPHLYMWVSTTASNAKETIVVLQTQSKFTKTAIGDGWFKVSTTYTVDDTNAGTLADIRFCPTGSGGATYIMDDFACVPTGLLDAEEMAGLTDNSYLINEDFNEGMGVIADKSATVERVTSGSVDDSAYLSCTPTATNGGIKQASITIEPNRVYKISWWAKAGDTTAVGYWLAPFLNFSGFEYGTDQQVRQAGKVCLTTESGSKTLTSEWQYFEGYYKSNNLPYVKGESISGYLDTRLMHPESGDGVGDSTKTFYVDNIVMEEMPVPFNGGFEKTVDFRTEWNSPATTYPVWIKGDNTTAADVSGDDPYVTVTQTANDEATDDLATRIFKQYVPRKANTQYKLSFKAKSDTATSLTLVYSEFDSSSAEIQTELEAAALTTDWQTFERIFTTSEATSNAVIGFSAERGANTSEVSYDIDEISITEYGNIIDPIALTGNPTFGGSITAGAVPRVSGTKVFYRVLCSSAENGNYACVAYGFCGDDNTITYQLTDVDGGRYTKMEFVGINSEGITNKVTTEPIFFDGCFLVFDSGIYDDNYTATATVLDAELADEDVSLLIAMYDQDGMLLSVGINEQPLSELTNSKISLTCPRVYGTAKVKAFLWIITEDKLKPLCEFKEVAEVEKDPNVVVNLAADGIMAEVIQSTQWTEAQYAAKADAYVGTYLKNTTVGKMLYNVNYKRAVTNSDVVDSILYNVELNEDGTPKKDENGNSIKTENGIPTNNVITDFRYLLEQDIDVFEMLVDSTKKYGAEAWFTLRMNDHHYPNDPYFNSTLGYSGEYGALYNGSYTTYLDFTNEVVQNYYKGYVKELCENYDIDGIDLDFLRSAPYMTTVDADGIEELNSYLCELRQVVDEVAKKKGKEIKLSARVYSTPELNLRYGLDAAQWIADGSIDILTASAHFIPTYYNIPIGSWREEIAEKNTQEREYTLLAGTDFGVTGDETSTLYMWLTLEQFKGFASSMYARGVDGIYMFNHAWPTSYQGATTYYVDADGNITSKNILSDKFAAAVSQEAAEQGERVYVNTRGDNTSIYPKTVTSTSSYSFTMNTGTKPANGHYTVVVGIADNEGYTDNNLTVSVNNTTLKQIGDAPKATDSASWPGSRNWVRLVSETSPRVMQFTVEDLSILNDGENTITISNTNADAPQKIKWIEIHVDGTEGATPLEQKVEEEIVQPLTITGGFYGDTAGQEISYAEGNTYLSAKLEISSVGEPPEGLAAT